MEYIRPMISSNVKLKYMSIRGLTLSDFHVDDIGEALLSCHELESFHIFESLLSGEGMKCLFETT